MKTSPLVVTNHHTTSSSFVLVPLLLSARLCHHLMDVVNVVSFGSEIEKTDFAINNNNNKDGDKFWKVPECYIRGNTIKYLCVS